MKILKAFILGCLLANTFSIFAITLPSSYVGGVAPINTNPTLRAASNLPLSANQIDANFIGLAIVANTANNKIISILDIANVRCDGVTNDATAINTALASAGYITLYVPTGITCAINSSLVININGLSIVSNGGKFKKLGNFDAIQINSNFNRIQNVDIDGNGFTGAGITVTGHNNVLDGNRIYGNGGYGIFLNGVITSSSYTNRVTNNNLYGNTLSAIQVNTSLNDSISFNSIYNNFREGISVLNSSNGTIITNNVVEGNNISGGVSAINIDNSVGVNFSNNTVKGAGTTLWGLVVSNTTGPSSGLNVSGNFFTINGVVNTTNTGGSIKFRNNGGNITTRSQIINNTFNGTSDNAIFFETGTTNNKATFNNLINGSITNNGSSNTISNN